MYNFCPFCGEEIKEQGDTGFKCQSCKKSIYYNSKPTASVIPIYQDQMLLTVRAIEPRKGGLDPIGGFLDYREDPLDGAVREFKEETGRDILKKDLRFLGFFMEEEYEFQDINYSILNIVYTIQFDQKEELQANDDVAELVWLPIKGDHKMAFSSMQRVVEELKKIR